MILNKNGECSRKTKAKDQRETEKMRHTEELRVLYEKRKKASKVEIGYASLSSALSVEGHQ